MYQKYFTKPLNATHTHTQAHKMEAARRAKPKPKAEAYSKKPAYQKPAYNKAVVAMPARQRPGDDQSRHRRSATWENIPDL